MAAATVNGIFFTYPDDPCMVFNPCIVTVGHTVARVRVGLNGIFATYQAKDGDCLIDIRSFLQAGFTGLRMGKDVPTSGLQSISELGKSVSVQMTAYDTDNTVLATYTASIFCIWGATAIGEVIEANEKWTMWRGYPFTYGRYFSAAESVGIFEYINGTSHYLNGYDPSSQGIWNAPINPTTGEKIEVRKHGQQAVIYATIKVEDFREGVYLRWVDRYGIWRYWLFKKGDPQREVASRFGMYDRIDYADYEAVYGWQKTSGRRQSYTRNDIQPLCAPLVDQDTFDRLQDITTSPCVDMLLDFDPNEKWTAVTVQPGTYTKDVKKPEQDFLLNLVLPEIPIQSL